MYSFLFKKWVNHSFPLFWWAMWVNRSGHLPKMSDVSKLLRSFTKNELPWAIVRDWLRLLTKNERMSESLVFLRESLIHSFLGKTRAIRSENRWANSQPWVYWTVRCKSEPVNIARKCFEIKTTFCAFTQNSQNPNRLSAGYSRWIGTVLEKCFG